MKKAVIELGGKQYFVAEKDVIDVELVGSDEKLSISPLIVIDGDNVEIGQPEVAKVKVTAKVLSEEKAEKVVAIRFKSKKRVNKKRGHRQKLNRIEILKIG